MGKLQIAIVAVLVFSATSGAIHESHRNLNAEECGVLVNTAADGSDDPESPDLARLELRATGNSEDPVLVVTFRNVGSAPIVVDRELVFGLYLKARLSNGDYVSPTVVRREETPKRDPVQWEQRFVRVAPGQAVTRRICLFERFRSFNYTVGIYPGMAERLSGGAEYVQRFDRNLDITHILVEYTLYPYTPHPHFARAFEGYTGLRLKAIDLFDRDLQAEVKLSR